MNIRLVRDIIHEDKNRNKTAIKLTALEATLIAFRPQWQI